MYLKLILLLLLLGRPALSPAGWDLPSCNRVSGTGSVTFTQDRGETLAPTVRDLHGIAYTYGLVALSAPNTLVAAHRGNILISENAGCRWQRVDRVSEPILNLVSAGRFAYGWTPNGGSLFRVTAGGAAGINSPAAQIVGLGVDPASPQHLRVGDSAGIIWDSTDGGTTWRAIGAPPVNDSLLLVYQVAFDPKKLNHVVVGVANHGSFVSRNGGANWKQSEGFSRSTNIFSIAISPVRSSIVWTMGLDIVQLDRGVPSQGRHIYRSEDGGLSFKPVVNHSRKVTLVNGPLLAAHSKNADVLYFVFGTFFADYGTDLFYYNHRTKELTKTHNSYDDISSIAFSPADPELLYLGLTVEDGIQ